MLEQLETPSQKKKGGGGAVFYIIKIMRSLSYTDEVTKNLFISLFTVFRLLCVEAMHGNTESGLKMIAVLK